MIDVSGDIIYFDNRPVGFIIIPNGSLRGDFMEALDEMQREINDELSKQLSDAEEGRDEAEWKIGKAISYIENNEEIDPDKILEILC